MVIQLWWRTRRGAGENSFSSGYAECLVLGSKEVIQPEAGSLIFTGSGLGCHSCPCFTHPVIPCC